MKARKGKTTPDRPAAGNGMNPPDDQGTQPVVPWLKLDPRTRLQMLCCSPTWLGAQTHWAQGRMKIHTEPNCRWCDTGSPIRFYFFLHVCDLKTKRQYVVQLSAGNIRSLNHAFDEYGTLRGCRIELARRGRSSNSPTVVAFLTPPYPIDGLPPAFNIRYKLQHAADWDDVAILDFDKPKETTA